MLMEEPINMLSVFLRLVSKLVFCSLITLYNILNTLRFLERTSNPKNPSMMRWKLFSSLDLGFSSLVLIGKYLFWS